MAKKRRTKRQRPGPGARPEAGDGGGATDEVEARPKGPAARAPRSDTASKQRAQPEVIATVPAAAPAPVFWFGFEVSWAKLAVARFALFALLALDATLQIAHAPRYGAGDFNVGQLPFLPDLHVGRVVYGTCQLLLAYAFVMIAFGVATRVLVPLAAVVYAWLYLGSQLDSYQHHYLVILVLAIASFVPWQRPADAQPATRIRTWAVRLLLVQLAIMYLWAAISKMDRAWVDGSTLGGQLTGVLAIMITKSIGLKVAAVLVIAIELALAATIWTRPGWWIAAPLGVLFHAGILFSGLEIGLFAYLMLGLYTLVVPDAVWVALVTGPLDRLGARLARPSWIAWGLGLVTAVALALIVRFEDAFVVAIGACAVPLAVAIVAVARGRRPAIAVGVAQVLAIGLWLVIDRATPVTVDYYRFWGGSQRRLGNLDAAQHAYRRLTEIAPDEETGHYQLGRLLLHDGAVEAGLAQLREAQRLEPGKARAFVEEARFLALHDQRPAAIEKARQATFADPSDASARALLDQLTSAKPAPAATPDSDDGD